LYGGLVVPETDVVANYGFVEFPDAIVVVSLFARGVWLSRSLTKLKFILATLDLKMGLMRSGSF